MSRIQWILLTRGIYCTSYDVHIKKTNDSERRNGKRTPTRWRMDPSTLEDILILKFNTVLWNAQLVQTILQEVKDQNRLCAPGTASTITSVTGGSSSRSSSSSSSSSSSGNSAVNISEDLDEDNDDERNGEANFDD